MSTQPGSGDLAGAPVSIGAYLWWALIGALFGVSLLSILSVGAAAGLVTLLLTVWSVRRPALANRGAVALVSGLAVMPAWLAWLDRKGPGRVCTTTPTSWSCEDVESPWPYLAVAVVLLVSGIAVSVLLARQGRSRPAVDRTNPT